MNRCKNCRWRDVCDLDCGDPQGYSYLPDDGEGERSGDDSDETEGERDE